MPPPRLSMDDTQVTLLNSTTMQFPSLVFLFLFLLSSMTIAMDDDAPQRPNESKFDFWFRKARFAKVQRDQVALEREQSIAATILGTPAEKEYHLHTAKIIAGWEKVIDHHVRKVQEHQDRGQQL